MGRKDLHFLKSAVDFNTSQHEEDDPHSGPEGNGGRVSKI